MTLLASSGVREGLELKTAFYIKLIDIMNRGGTAEDRQIQVERFLLETTTDIMASNPDK
jgi:hypothetical protein